MVRIHPLDGDDAGIDRLADLVHLVCPMPRDHMCAIDRIHGQEQMAETIKVELPHKLTRAQARQRLEDGLQRIHENIAGKSVSVEQTWAGDHLDFTAAFMGQSITGRLDVEDDHVRLEMDLPWLLASIANSLKGRLKKEGTLLLERK
jgi:putative polyhydroxyalkanoate system protein